MRCPRRGMLGGGIFGGPDIRGGWGGGIYPPCISHGNWCCIPPLRKCGCGMGGGRCGGCWMGWPAWGWWVTWIGCGGSWAGKIPGGGGVIPGGGGVIWAGEREGGESAGCDRWLGDREFPSTDEVDSVIARSTSSKLMTFVPRGIEGRLACVIKYSVRLSN